MNFKRIFISLIISLSLTNMTIAQETQTNGDYFGIAKFGSTRDEIKEVEKTSKLIFDTKEELVFNETSDFIGKSQNCFTFDKDGKMVAGTINIINDHEDLSKYIEDYNKINEAFQQVYGEPDESGFSTDDEALLKDAAKLAPGVHIVVEGTTNTSYNGLMETNAGGTLTCDGKDPINVDDMIIPWDDELTSKSPSAIYRTSQLVSLTGWKITEKLNDPARDATKSIFKIERDGTRCNSSMISPS